MVPDSVLKEKRAELATQNAANNKGLGKAIMQFLFCS